VFIRVKTLGLLLHLNHEYTHTHTIEWIQGVLWLKFKFSFYLTPLGMNFYVKNT